MDIDQVRDMIKQAHLPEKTEQLCLRGDLQTEFEKLEQQLQSIATRRARESMADDGGHSVAQPIAEQMEALRTEMQDSSIEVTLRALRRPDWKKLIAGHPPRQGDEGDQRIGLNRETFYDALILQCWISPELDKKEIGEFLDLITSAQFDKLATAAWELNRHDVSVPFSRTASRIAGVKNFDATPKQQPDSASRSGGGTAGSRRKSPSSNTTKKAG